MDLSRRRLNGFPRSKNEHDAYGETHLPDRQQPTLHCRESTDLRNVAGANPPIFGMSRARIAKTGFANSSGTVSWIVPIFHSSRHGAEMYPLADFNVNPLRGSTGRGVVVRPHCLAA